MSYEEVGKILFIPERSVRRYVDHFYSWGPLEMLIQLNNNMGHNVC